MVVVLVHGGDPEDNHHARIQGGAKGALAPPPPNKILLPQIVRRGPRGPWPPPPGGQEGLGPPPYKILDPPMIIVSTFETRGLKSAATNVYILGIIYTIVIFLIYLIARPIDLSISIGDHLYPHCTHIRQCMPVCRISKGGGVLFGEQWT